MKTHENGLEEIVEATTQKPLYRGFESPLAYFLAHKNDYKGMSRKELSRADSGLAIALRRHKQIDTAIPLKKARQEMRSYGGNPLDYFLANQNKYKGLSRSELKKIDAGLYSSLIAHKQINQAIPERKTHKRDRKIQNPLNYFREHEEYRGMTRSQLRDYDQGLYVALRRHKQLDDAIPKKESIKKRPRSSGFRTYESPYGYFLAHKEKFAGLTREQLRKKDRELYYALYNARQMALAIPALILPHTYRGFESPLAYFLAHEKYQGLNRFELQKIDSGLHSALYRTGQLATAIPKKE